VSVRFTFAEEGGERFTAVRAATPDFTVLRIGLDELQPDALWNLGVPPANADGQLQPGAVKEWRLEIMPATERQAKGTITIKDVRAVGPEIVKPKAAPAPMAARPKPVAKKAAPKPVAKPAPAGDAAPGDEEAAPAAEDTILDDSAPAEPPPEPPAPDAGGDASEPAP
jgi:hypothetical protein